MDKTKMLLEDDKKNYYSLKQKKDDICKLKECAKVYKKYLLGKRFLVCFDDGRYIEILFTKSEFKHLTGISSNLGAVKFYNLCIGEKTRKSVRYISPNDIFVTKEHPRIFALKKLNVFPYIFELFSKGAYVLEDISESKRFFRTGLANFELTILADKTNKYENTYIAISLKSESHIKNASKFSKVVCVYEKTNPYLKYCDLIYPKETDLVYLNKHKKTLSEVIEYK